MPAENPAAADPAAAPASATAAPAAASRDAATPGLSRRQVVKAAAVAGAAAWALASPILNFAQPSGSDAIKVGLIGCGGRGRGAAGNVVESSEGVSLVALGDLFPDHMDEAKQIFAEKNTDEKSKGKFNIPADKCFIGWDAYKQVLALPEVNYVILATPPGFRPMMVEAAIAAGKHVFAEKPVAVDPVGARRILASAKVAAEKNLGLIAGTQRRHHRGYMETVQRIHDGAIGQVTSGQVYWTQGGLWNKPREPKWGDLENQLRNWVYYTWLSGDIIVEQHLHNIDVANWVIGSHPKLAIASGGRQVRTDAIYGNVYDHFAVDFEYPAGQRVMSVCRQIDNCYGRIQEHFIGTNGEAFADNLIKGPNAWKYAGKPGNPYVWEHKDFIESIRAGKPLNEGQTVAESTLSAIMGRMSAYTGQLVSWNDVMTSKLNLMPEKLDLNGPFPTPPVSMPGVDKLV